MAKQKKVKLKDMTDEELLKNYTYAVCHSWGENILSKGPRANPAHSPSYQRELSLNRELLRRLNYKQTPVVHNESQREMRLRMGF